MKKSVLFLAFWMMFSSVFTSCNDDLDNALNVHEVSKDSAAHGMSIDGAYQSIAPLGQDNRYMNIVVNGDTVMLRVTDAEGSVVNAVTAKGVRDVQGRVSVVLDKAFEGMKSFTFETEGSFCYLLRAQMENGEQQRIAFWDNGVAPFSADDDVTNQFMLKVAKGATVGLVKLLPGGSFFSGVVSAVFPSGSTDMKVGDAYKMLDRSMQQIKNQLNCISNKLENMDTRNVLIAHQELQGYLFTCNNMCMAQIASLVKDIPNVDLNYIMSHPELKKQIYEVMLAWGNYNVQGNPAVSTSQHFITDVANGYGLGEKKSWSHLVDTYAERTYAWEHQGYEIRELYRSRDMITALQASMLLNLYHEMVSSVVDFDQTNMEAIRDNFLKYAVVRDNDHAVCQIPGANHLKIARSSYATVPFMNADNTPTFNFENEYWIRKTAQKFIGQMVFSDNTYRDLSWFVVPNGWKMKEEDQKAALGKMITLQEAQTIYNYYGGKLSFHEILQNEAGIPDKDYKTDKDNVMMVSNGNVKWETCTESFFGKDRIKLDVEHVCHMDRKNNDTFAGYGLGIFNKKELHDGENNIWLSFDSWYKHEDNVHIKNMTVDSREAGWTPGGY